MLEYVDGISYLFGEAFMEEALYSLLFLCLVQIICRLDFLWQRGEGIGCVYIGLAEGNINAEEK